MISRMERWGDRVTVTVNIVRRSSSLSSSSRSSSLSSLSSSFRLTGRSGDGCLTTDGGCLIYCAPVRLSDCAIAISSPAFALALVLFPSSVFWLLASVSCL
jgi:hypothetical protein